MAEPGERLPGWSYEAEPVCVIVEPIAVPVGTPQDSGYRMADSSGLNLLISEVNGQLGGLQIGPRRGPNMVPEHTPNTGTIYDPSVRCRQSRIRVSGCTKIVPQLDLTVQCVDLSTLDHEYS